MAGKPAKQEPPAEGEGFLGRWSRRKVEARAEPTGEETGSTQPAARAGAPREIEPQVPPEELPDIESLSAASDFKAFMQKGVPDELRTLALRKLWRLKPSLANLDGLVDYGEDLTGRTTVVAAGLKSAYQAGRGYLDRLADTETDQSEAESSAEEAERADPEQARPIDQPEPSLRGADEGASAKPAADAGRGDHPTGAGKPRPLPRRS